LSTISSNGTRCNICIRALTNTNGGSSLPDRITSLTVRGKTDQSVTLVWPAAKDAQGYEVYYSIPEDGPYILAGQAEATDRKFKCTGLTAGTTYYFKVYPLKGGSRYDAGVSPVVSAATSTAKPEVEMINIGMYQATARWEPLESCDGYEYTYGKGTSSFTPQTTTDNEIQIRQLDPGSEHFIEVKAYKKDNNGNNVYSEACRVTFTTKSGSCHPVTNLTVSPYTSSMVKLTWDDQEDIWNYKLEQSTNGVNFSEADMYYIGSKEPRTVRYANNLVPNQTYYFRIKAEVYSFSGGSEPLTYTSGAVSGYTKLQSSSDINASIKDGAVNLTWASVAGANYYSIYRKESSASEYLPLDVVSAAGGLKYTDTTVFPGRLYYYRVYGCRTNVLTNEQGEGSSGIGITTPLDQLSDLQVEVTGPTTAVLTWGPITGAQGYIVKLYDNDTAEWVEKDRVDKDITTYTLRDLLPGTRYYALVMAYTDVRTGGGDYVTFQTAPGTMADKSFFTVTDLTKTYTGSPQHPTVTCSNAEVNSAGFSILYGKKQGGTVSSYSTEEPVATGEYQIRIRTNASANFTATELTDDSWVFTIDPQSVTPAQTVTFSGVTGGKVNKTYGADDYTLTATASGTITYTSSDPSVAAVGLSDGCVHILKTGETTITATAAQTDTQAAGSASYLLVVGKKEIGIS
ncbi:MAG TPA: hypothetical protein DIS78_01290, partial [Lachnospiraceae bacterium]|nr:hypothetical protein [Lachnospiraceae bacterium]